MPTLVGLWTKQRSSRKTSTFASLTMLKPLTVWITTLWKILKEMGILDHLTCLLRNFYVGQEATVRTLHRTTDWLKIGKEVQQGYKLSLYLNSMQNTLCEMTGCMNHKVEIKTARRYINNLRYADDTTIRKRRRGTKESLNEGEKKE